MKKLIFLMAVFFSLSGTAQNSQIFEAANKDYAEENYEAAVNKYEQILDNGETSENLHFNLGNAYYKLDRVAPSIYHYEKALQLNPANEDAKNNLEFAKKMAIDAIGKEPAEGFWDIFNTSTSAFSASGWGWVAIFCMLVFVVFIIVYYFSRRTLVKRILFISGMFFLVLAITSAVIGFSKQSLQEEHSFAIVFADQVEVKNEPSVRGSDVFLLHEGAKVKITENFQEWVEIELPNGSRGWMEQSALKNL